MPEDLEPPELFELLALLALAFAEPSPHFGPQPTMIATSIATVTTAAIITRASRFLFKSASSGCVGCVGLVDSAVRGGRDAGNSSFAFRGCGSVRTIGAVIATGRSVSSVTAIGGRGFVGLLQGLLELLGLLVILGFRGVGFADGGG